MAIGSEIDAAFRTAGADMAQAASIDAAAAPGAVVLSTVPPSQGEARLALLLVFVSAVACAAAIPFSRLRFSGVPSFIGVYETALIVNDAITALLLFGQFVQGRSHALYVLACGYLFDAVVIVPHMLSFPGTVCGGRLDRRRQPDHRLALHDLARRISALRHSLCDARQSRRPRPPAPMRGTARSARSRSCAVVGAVTLQVTTGVAMLPAVVVDNRYTPGDDRRLSRSSGC